jgi:NAD(P)-dependent dehydrogenase (short-subunit alcohol dehydrogenase family)
MPVAVITGASTGLGRALATCLAARGWALIIDGRRRDRLELARIALAARTDVVAIAGDVAQPAHRIELAAAVARHGRLDLLVNNASTLGPTPLRPVTALTPGEFGEILAVNTIAPLAMIELLRPFLVRADGSILNITSDAATEHYATWGGYGASKLALEHLTLTLAAENPHLPCYAVDPGDLRTEMHQAAFPDEDISDRPLPEAVVEPMLALIGRRAPSGRYRVADLVERPAGELAAAR